MWIAPRRTAHLLDELTAIRRDLHAHPETAFEERRTASRMAEGIASAHGVSAELDYDRRYRDTVNDPEQAALMLWPMTATMGAEDFGWMLAHAPGAYGVIGNGTEGSPSAGLHRPAYDFNDAIIPIGVAFWINLVTAFFREREADLSASG